MIVLFCAFLALVLLFGDLIVKAWAEATAVFQGEYFLGIIRWNYTKNAGMAFGIFSDNPSMMYVVTALTVAMIVGLAVLFFTLFKKNVPARVALAAIEAGAIGNLVDRLILGYVRDMVDVAPLGFGVCNLADFYVTFGAVALVIIILFIGKDAAFPLAKKWREEQKREEEKRERKGDA